jgi:hypothetical protein
MTNYLELAKAKYNQNTEVDYNLGFNDFIMDCYVRLKPCSYGGKIQQKISLDVNLISIAPNENRGDVLFNDKFAEIKTSYLGKNKTYRLTHLRMWQKFTYYIICFIDCENDFTPELYLIDKNIMDKFKLTPMNGTTDSNSENNNIELSCTIKKGGPNHNILERYNKLSGTTIDNLKDFVNKNK